MLRCKIGDLCDVIWPLVKADVPVCIRGRSGIGKSDIINHELMALVRAEYGDDAVLHDFRLSSKDITDGTGIPDIDRLERATYWTRPAFIPKDDGKMHIIFLDEISHASVQMQHSVGYQVVRDRGLGEFKLPKRNRVLCAMNIAEDKGGDMKLAKPFENRMAHVFVESGVPEWVSWAKGHKVHHTLMAFIELKPEFLHKMNEANPAWSSPRTLEMLSRVMLAERESKTVINAARALCGEDFATIFNKFLEDWGANLPRIETIIANPNKAKVPDDLHQQYSIAVTISVYLAADNVGQLVTYLKRLAPDLASMAAHNAMQRDPKLAPNKLLGSLLIGKPDGK